MPTYRTFQVDSFTKTRFKGNPAGVVLDADGLTTEQMQSIARELNNSETVFLLQPEDDTHEVRLRFFTPTMEVPTCGHATVAAHYIRATVNDMPSGRIFHKIGVGTLPIDIVRDGDDLKIYMTQMPPEFDAPLDQSDAAVVLQALGVSQSDLDPRCPVQKVSTGNSKYIVGLRKQSILHGLQPDMAAIKRFAEKFPCIGIFVFCFSDEGEDVLTHARMFAPHIGIDEDPVTGNGNGPLGCYLVANELVDHDGKRFSFTSIQGEAMGRPGIAEVEVDILDGQPTGVRVGGSAVIAFETEITI